MLIRLKNLNVKKITTFLILFSFYFSAIGQSIDGRVLEETSSGKIVPIIGANVYWENNNAIGTVTDKNGYYSIQEVPSMPRKFFSIIHWI